LTEFSAIAGYASAMPAELPRRIVSYRWPYLAMAAAVGLASMAVTMLIVLVLQHRWDWTVVAMFGPVDVGLVALLIRCSGNFRMPPTLLIDAEGLTLRTGRRERFWEWRQIDKFREVRSRIGSYASFAWRPKPDAWTRTTFLYHPFPGQTAALVQYLNGALELSHKASAPTVIASA
jgi:hypothetical protein